MRVVVVTWAPGGNLPPLLAAAALLDRRGHEVTVLASGETSSAAERAGFGVTRYQRSPDPDTRVAFEAQAEQTMATMAGPKIALDSRDVLDELRPDLAIVDCMLPAAIAAGRATGTPTVSLVHFLYGPARRQMLRSERAWTTDLGRLAQTHRMLGLPPPRDGLRSWESPELLLVTAPRWFDVDCGAPEHVVHAGPLGIDVGSPRAARAEARPRKVLLTFSTTVMAAQEQLVERACEAVAGLGLDAVLTLGPAVERKAVRIPDGIHVMPSSDHDRLMADCAAVIDHGGLGTVLRALAHGLPQLLLALGRDQAFNADRVALLGAGSRLAADVPPERIRQALQILLREPRFSAAAARAAKRIAADQPDRRAAEALERAAGPGGRS